MNARVPDGLSWCDWRAGQINGAAAAGRVLDPVRPQPADAEVIGEVAWVAQTLI